MNEATNEREPSHEGGRGREVKKLLHVASSLRRCNNNARVHIIITSLDQLQISFLVAGVEFHDTCDNDDIVESHLFQLISATRGRAVTGPPLLGES